MGLKKINWSTCNQLLSFQLINFNWGVNKLIIAINCNYFVNIKHGISFNFRSKSFQNIIERVNQQMRI